MKAAIYKVNPLGWATCKWLKHFWKGCLGTKLNGFSIRKIPSPKLPGPEWVCIRTRLGGICGSDAGMVMQKQPPDTLLQAYSSQPMGMGHENVGEVLLVGDNVDESWVGKRVIVEPTLACKQRGLDPVCPRCAEGNFSSCQHFSADEPGPYGLPPGLSIGYNSMTGGSWGEYFVAHVSQLFEVPDHVSDEEAVMVDPFACSAHGVFSTNLENVERVLVYGGGGIIGLGVIASLRASGFTGTIDAYDRGWSMKPHIRTMGADELLVDPGNKAEKYDMFAVRTGATVQRVRFGNRTLTGGYDVVFDCVGTGDSFTDCLKLCRGEGQVTVLGTLQVGRVGLTSLWFREITARGVYGRGIESHDGIDTPTYKVVLDWIANGTISVKDLVTHHFRLDQLHEALVKSTEKARHGIIKAVFDFRPKD
ncbi:MAG: alcohol dehydrogenase catalytic domain-containing protein [Phycisphaerales bacterium]|jgi:threonine dehydrogenase-like Zn-dependent dehydrogenase|nr:alcohol dehydrogenase catalytic domain-containing protein [Phycisphaerales bacterium]